MRWGNFLLGRVRKLLFCIMSQPKLWERKEYSFSHWCVLTSLCRDGTHAVTMSGCCRLLRRACIVQASSFSSAGFCLGFFFMQHNSHVKLICVSCGSCSMRRRLIVPSVCSSPVPVCIQGISDLLIIPETHSHGVVWFVFDAQNGVHCNLPNRCTQEPKPHFCLACPWVLLNGLIVQNKHKCQSLVFHLRN